MMPKPVPRVYRLDAAALRRWPLPMPPPDGDKEERGRVLVIGGAREMPGGVILAATAALRAGAGKLTIATCRSVAALVALAIRESRVIALPETSRGAVSTSAARAIEVDDTFDAVLIGPGMEGETATRKFVTAMLPKLKETTLVLDACAMNIVRGSTARAAGMRFSQRVILTPHAGEMAHLTGVTKDEVETRPLDAARSAAARWNAVVALKGATTFVAAPDGRVWRHEGKNIGLAVSGSGDTLAGIIAGLAAHPPNRLRPGAWRFMPELASASPTV